MSSFISNQLCWDTIASTYDQDTTISIDEIHFGPLAPGEKTLNILGDLSGKRVLELGCGGGHNTVILSNMGASVIGIDFSTSQLRIAKGRAPQVRNIYFVQADINHICLTHGMQFDLIFSVFALDFIEDLLGLFTKMTWHMNPDSRFVFACKHPLAWHVADEREQRTVITNYFQPYEKHSEWKTSDFQVVVSKTYYRPLELWFEYLAEAGLSIKRFHELRAVSEGQTPYESSYFRKKENLLKQTPYTMLFETCLK